MPDNKSPSPNALLLVSSHCPHCHAMLTATASLLKKGVIGQLEMVNIEVNPQRAQDLGVRSVPWLRLGEFTFHEALGESELERWAELAAAGSGRSDYFIYLLAQRRLEELLGLLGENPHWQHDLIAPLALEETPITTLIAIGAALESLAEQSAGTLDPIVPELVGLLDSRLPQTRADACHYLALAEAVSAIPQIERLSDDPDPQVQEIARDSLAILCAVSQSRD